MKYAKLYFMPQYVCDKLWYHNITCEVEKNKFCNFTVVGYSVLNVSIRSSFLTVLLK